MMLNFVIYGGAFMDVNPNSMAARLYKIQNEIDAEIGEKEPCGEWCSRCLCVSETEFVQILDYLLNNWPRGKILEIIKKSKDQMDMLENERPETARKIKGKILLKDLFKLDKETLPFRCVFCDESGRCMIEKVRPLKCRAAKLAEFDETAEAVLKKEICSFIFLRKDDDIIFTRPEPLFYFLCLIFEDENELDQITEADFFRGILSLDEAEYINMLTERK